MSDSFPRGHISSPTSYSPLSNMNKLHNQGGISKPSSVNLMGQQPQQHHSAPSSLAHMGESLSHITFFGLI